MQPGGAERRSAVRLPTALQCQITFVQDFRVAAAAGSLYDVSWRGASLACLTHLELGTLLAVRLTDRDCSVVYARVAWKIPRPTFASRHGLVLVEGGFPYAVFADSTRAQSLTLHAEPESPDCIRILNLSWPCDAAAIKRAYHRLAKRSHPDQGGTQAAFLRLHRAYSDALALFEQ